MNASSSASENGTAGQKPWPKELNFFWGNPCVPGKEHRLKNVDIFQKS